MSTLLDKMMLAAEASIRRHIGKRQTLMPVWHVVHADGQSEVIGTPWADGDEKQTIFAAMREMFRTTDVIAYCLTVEAWATPSMMPADVKAIVPTGDINDLIPSEMPDRVEIFTATASDGSETLSVIWDIRRDKRGRVQAVIKRDPDNIRIGGTVAEMLKPEQGGHA